MTTPPLLSGINLEARNTPDLGFDYHSSFSAQPSPSRPSFLPSPQQQNHTTHLYQTDDSVAYHSASLVHPKHDSQVLFSGHPHLDPLLQMYSNQQLSESSLNEAQVASIHGLQFYPQLDPDFVSSTQPFLVPQLPESNPMPSSPFVPQSTRDSTIDSLVYPDLFDMAGSASPPPSTCSSAWSSVVSSPRSYAMDDPMIPIVACASCKRSHIKCDSGRPCQNCLKHPAKALTCRDAVPKPRGRPKGGSKAAAHALLMVKLQQEQEQGQEQRLELHQELQEPSQQRPFRQRAMSLSEGSLPCSLAPTRLIARSPLRASSRASVNSWHPYALKINSGPSTGTASSDNSSTGSSSMTQSPPSLSEIDQLRIVHSLPLLQPHISFPGVPSQPSLLPSSAENNPEFHQVQGQGHITPPLGSNQILLESSALEMDMEVVGSEQFDLGQGEEDSEVLAEQSMAELLRRQLEQQLWMQLRHQRQQQLQQEQFQKQQHIVLGNIRHRRQRVSRP